MELTTWEGFKELDRIRPQFLKLFKKCFGRKYPVKYWEHYYKDIPCAPPRGVSLWNGGNLVGFSALLMQELLDRESRKLIPYGYYVTSMIDPDHRKGGLAYLQIVNKIKFLGENSGLKLIIGFPNNNNFLPMTRLANFKLFDSARFVRARNGLGRYKNFLAKEMKKNFFSERLWLWRLSRFPYKIEDGCLTKVFQGENNILDWLEVSEKEDVDGIFPFWFSFGECPFEPVDENIIRFCYLPIDSEFNPQTLKRSILYSDVF